MRKSGREGERKYEGMGWKRGYEGVGKVDKEKKEGSVGRKREQL